MARLRALIVGCGNIAGSFDVARGNGAELPLTHAGAYARDGRFEVAGCVDPDDDRREAFMASWKVQLGVASIDELPGRAERFDVISICSPTRCHAHDLEVSLQLRPRAVFCEKPTTETAARTEGLVDEYRRAGIPLAVDYTRRWDPSISELERGMREGRWGPLRTVVGYYGKGLLNNGSHLLDLLSLLLGPLGLVRVGNAVADHSLEDPSVPVWLETSTGVPIMLTCGHASDFTFFEFQLVFAKGVVTMEEGGLFWRERGVVESATFAGHRSLGAGVRRAGGYEESMLAAVDNLHAAVLEGRALASTGETALETQRLCEAIWQAREE